MNARTPFSTPRVAQAVAVCMVLLSGCSTSRPEPALDPHRTLAEVVAVLEQGANADLYRFDPPTDVTGENLFRSSLARLDRCAELIDDAGFGASIDFARGRAKERLLDYAAAVELYARVASGSSPLARRAGELAEFPRQMARIEAEGATDQENLSPPDLLMRIARKKVGMRELMEGMGDDVRASLVMASIERLDVREREFLWRTRALFPNGSEVALTAARELVADHVESRRALEHSLRLADMYAELARAYVAAVDPSGYDFDAAYARNLIQSASQIYAEVAAVDGRIEREEARAALAGLEALAIRLGAGGEQ